MHLTEKDALQKIAKLVLYEVPHTQIAMSCGVTEGRISQICGTEEFKAVLQEIAVAHFEEQDLLNQGWDAVEQHAVSKVLQTLQHSPDPDYALKAAAVANKVTRRGRINHNPLTAGQAGVRAIVNVNMNFAEKLQNNFKVTDARGEHKQKLEENRKQTSFLAVKDVQDMLKPQLSEQQIVEKELNGIEING